MSKKLQRVAAVQAIRKRIHDDIILTGMDHGQFEISNPYDVVSGIVDVDEVREVEKKAEIEISWIVIWRKVDNCTARYFVRATDKVTATDQDDEKASDKRGESEPGEWHVFDLNTLRNK